MTDYFIRSSPFDGQCTGVPSQKADGGLVSMRPKTTGYERGMVDRNRMNRLARKLQISPKQQTLAERIWIDAPWFVERNSIRYRWTNSFVRMELRYNNLRGNASPPKRKLPRRTIREWTRQWTRTFVLVTKCPQLEGQIFARITNQEEKHDVGGEENGGRRGGLPYEFIGRFVQNRKHNHYGVVTLKD